MGCGHLNFFLRTTEPEELVFMVTGVGKGKIGKTIVAYVYIEKKNLPLQNQQAYFDQT
jgi:hypothetical protein